MAQRNTKTNNESKKATKKEYKNQNFKMRGKLEKWDTFGKNTNKHAWFVVAEETNGTKYMIKKFNLTDREYDILADSENVEVYFNLSYNKVGNDIALHIVASEIHSAD